MTNNIYVVTEHLRGQVTEISYVMLAAAHDLAKSTGGQVIALLLGHQVEGLSSQLAADQVWYVDHAALADFTPEAYQMVLSELIRREPPRAVLLGNTSIGADVAGVLSGHLHLPLVSACHHFTDGHFVAQICGGKLLAEGELPSPTALVTMVPGGYKPEQGQSMQPPPLTRLDASPLPTLRTQVTGYIEPEAGDVDITKQAILVAVGRGIQNKDNIELAEALAEALGGAVCGSRPVVDQGWLPTSRLVGKSGKRVKPKIYLALGISGAPEHVEGMGESDTIIAINTDPQAPIFNLATYGVEADLFDVVELLTNRIRKVKSG